MKRFFAAVVAASGLLAGNLHADCTTTPCCRNSCCCGAPLLCCCGEFEVGAEGLFFRPSVCDLTYAIQDPRPFDAATFSTILPVGKQHSINPDYEWGYRIMVGYIFDDGCSDIRVQYSRLKTRDQDGFRTESDGVGGMWIAFGQPRFDPFQRPLFGGIPVAGFSNQVEFARATSRSKFIWDTVDLQVASRTMCGCSLFLRAWAGLSWVNIDIEIINEYEGVQDPGQSAPKNWVVNQKDSREIWGVGPRIGLDTQYNLWCGFGLAARIGVGLFAGETDGHFHQCVQRFNSAEPPPFGVLELQTELQAEFSDAHHLTPEWDARLGLNYTWCCSDCFAIILEAGYEFITYINVFERNFFNSDGASQSDVCYSFNMDGIYIMLRVAF